MDRAIEMEELAHEIKYPNDVDTFATSVTSAQATQKAVQSGRSPIIGYAMLVKMTGMTRNSGNSATVLPRKYVSVR